jgi:hypothetical protein
MSLGNQSIQLEGSNDATPQLPFDAPASASGASAKRAATRWKAAAIHLGLSGVIVAAVLLVSIALWYPAPYFKSMGGESLLTILAGVDVIVGPIITLIIFDTKKKDLKMDLAIIAAVQAAALSYGVHTMFLARPVFAVFSVDRFDVVSDADIDPGELAKGRTSEFQSLSWTGPKLVVADLPTDPQERQKLIFSSLSGLDVQHFPKYYVPYGSRVDEIRKHLKPLSELRAKRSAEEVSLVEQSLKSTGLSEDAVGYLPVTAKKEGMIAILRRGDAQVTAILPISLW